MIYKVCSCTNNSFESQTWDYQVSAWPAPHGSTQPPVVALSDVRCPWTWTQVLPESVSWVHIQIESPPFNRFTSNSFRSLQNLSSHLWRVYCRHHQQSLRNVLMYWIWIFSQPEGCICPLDRKYCTRLSIYPVFELVHFKQPEVLKALSPPDRVHFQQIKRLFEDIWMFDQPNRGLYINICWFGIQPTRGLHLAPRQEVTAELL